MTEFFGIPPATYEQLDADYIAADRARQLDEAVYAQALADPETCERYRSDLGFRMQIDLHRQALHAMDAALAEEGASPEQRNRILQRLITGREPYRGVNLLWHGTTLINLPHGPFTVTIAPPLVGGAERESRVVATCACGAAWKWPRHVSGGLLLAWLRDHPPQRELHEAAKRPSPDSLFGAPATRKEPAGD